MTSPPYPEFSASLQDQLQRVTDCSPFAAELIVRYPDEFKALVESGALEHDNPTGRPPETGSADFDSRLRIYRNLSMLRIIWRDLNGLSGLEESLADLSGLADVCIQRSLDHHSGLLQARHGETGGQRLIVIAMGKLGGRELNLSSDVDLVFVYPGEGETTGKRKLSHSEYFTRVTRALITSLSEQTEHGFVFRVDARLRPYGDSGPLVVSEAAIEQYYQREGREWERYALIKARTVAGDLDAGRQLLDRLKPFVYRRYVDFGVFESLREMAQKLGDEANRRGWDADIKRGPGGIREAEFFVQSFQLLRGGKEPSLQTNSFFEAAHAVADLGLVEPAVIDRLVAAYSYLRVTENRLQALHDRQTHLLPESQDDQRSLAMAMAESGWEDLCKTQEQHRLAIREVFNTLAKPEPASDQGNRRDDLWEMLSSQEDSLAPLAKIICNDADAAINPLLSFQRYLARTALSQRAQERLERLMPQLLDRLAEAPLSPGPLNNVLDLVRAISRRSAYLVLLSENLRVLDRLLDLFENSPWIAEQVIRYPLLLDELIDPRLSLDMSGRESLATILAQTVKTDQDDGQQLIALNEFKLGMILRIAIAELENQVDVRTAQQILSNLAEVLLERVLQMAIVALADRFPQAGDIDLGVVAYGTLGARELGYHSDLDLVFLYQRGEAEREKAEQYSVRVSQRMLTYLSSQSASGSLYSVDTRLRPNGSSGSLVSTLETFETYQAEESWTWEQQALTRARWIAGSAVIDPLFAAVRESVCGKSRQADVLTKDIVSMRERVRAQKYDADKRSLDFKHGPGGLLDVEFICQYGVLQNASATPELLQTTNTSEQISRLHAAGFLSGEDAVKLDDAWLAFSRARHFAALTHARDIGVLDPHMSFVRALWGRLFDAEQGAPAP